MNQPKIPLPTIDQITHWLVTRFEGEVGDLKPLSGGYWSSAYRFRAEGQDYVLRLSEMAEGFTIDKAAMRFQGADLPIPTVTEIGVAFGFNYAISERHFGRFMEAVDEGEGEAVGLALAKLLAALRAAPTTTTDPVTWFDPEAAAPASWRAWLKAGLIDNPANLVCGWRQKLAETPAIEALFEACVTRIHELLPSCPERRDLVHGDLLHQNVLVSADATRVTAIFSWKCSALGDFLYDVAWCTFWRDWHPGIAASNIWQRTLTAPDLSVADLRDAPLRHHCYELQIGATHLGWNAWTGNAEALAEVAVVLKQTLANGPRQLANP